MVGLSFGNPLGWLALLGIPVVLVLHFLQRKVRRERVATLFLLPPRERQSERGRRWDRLRGSWPLWLQLLAVGLLAVVLAGPRWRRDGEVRRLVIVLDGSASMRVSRDRLLRYLGEDLGKVERGGVQLELMVLDSRPGRGRIHYGVGVAGLLESLTAWEPGGGSHDFGPAVVLGRKLAGSDGIVWLASDRPVAGLGEGVQLYAVGEAVENAGIAGVVVEDAEGGTVRWKALLRSSGEGRMKRRWRVEPRAGGEVGQSSEVELGPGAMVAVGGEFPAGASELVVRMDGDAFGDDDAAPLVRPRQRIVKVAVEGLAGSELRRLLGSLASVEVVTGSADLRVREQAAPEVPPSEVGEVIFVSGGEAGRPPGPVLVEPHELTRDLDWAGLLVESVGVLAAREGDAVLVWSGDDPLVVLRARGAKRQLIFCFAPGRSNAWRLPAVVVALHRFVEGQRAMLPGDAVVNAGCGQLLRAGAVAAGGEVRWEWESLAGKRETAVVLPREVPMLRAPGEPGFFRLSQDGRDLLSGAAAFADVREADFAGALTDRRAAAVMAGRDEARSGWADPFWRPVLLVLLFVLALGWWAADARPVVDQSGKPSLRRRSRASSGSM